MFHHASMVLLVGKLPSLCYDPGPSGIFIRMEIVKKKKEEKK
jgi:hypothetical protein